MISLNTASRMFVFEKDRERGVIEFYGSSGGFVLNEGGKEVKNAVG
tara:strand:+ start:376 stop:513 length:138 start_codon:yes stop_codon:yes gene_type:complete